MIGRESEPESGVGGRAATDGRLDKLKNGDGLWLKLSSNVENLLRVVSKTYIAARGFGFVWRESAPDLLFHSREFRGEERDIGPGAPVEFTVTDGKEGPCAEDVALV